jgi:hypothetical protein
MDEFAPQASLIVIYLDELELMQLPDEVRSAIHVIVSHFQAREEPTLRKIAANLNQLAATMPPTLDPASLRESLEREAQRLRDLDDAPFRSLPLTVVSKPCGGILKAEHSIKFVATWRQKKFAPAEDDQGRPGS